MSNLQNEINTKWISLTSEQRKQIDDWITSHITINQEVAETCESTSSLICESDFIQGELPQYESGDVQESSVREISSFVCDLCGDCINIDDENISHKILEHVLTFHIDTILNNPS